MAEGPIPPTGKATAILDEDMVFSSSGTMPTTSAAPAVDEAKDDVADDAEDVDDDVDNEDGVHHRVCAFCCVREVDVPGREGCIYTLWRPRVGHLFHHFVKPSEYVSVGHWLSEFAIVRVPVCVYCQLLEGTETASSPCYGLAHFFRDDECVRLISVGGERPFTV